MPTSTFSFLLVYDDITDTVTYEVQPEFTFEQVIDHICISFGFEREKVEIKSNLGFEIGDFNTSVEEIMQNFGTYYKMIVHTTTVPTMRPTNEPITKPLIDPHFGEDETQQLVDDVFEDLMLLNSETWSVDDEGNVELTLVPRLSSRITQLRMKFSTEEKFSELVDVLANLFAKLPEELIMTPLEENAVIIDDSSLSIMELVETYGALLVVYPIERRAEIESNTLEVTEEIRSLLFKYKRREQ